MLSPTQYFHQFLSAPVKPRLYLSHKYKKCTYQTIEIFKWCDLVAFYDH